MKGLTLIEAIINIAGQQNLKEAQIITGIQYEDGSGFKFNVQIDHGEWQFVDLSGQPNFIQVMQVSGFNQSKSEFEKEIDKRFI